jgi:hypothetical protein
MGFNGTSRAVTAALAAMMLVAYAAPPASAAGSGGHLLLFPGKGGANTAWISGNDAGQAVGQKLSGNVSDFVYFDANRPHDLTARLGHGAFSSIDALGEAAGTTSSGSPLYYDTRSKHKAILPVQGRGTGIAPGPLVAVTLSNGTAELWNPLSGGTLALGQASTTGVNASGTVVGHAADGNLWYSVPNGSGGATQTELPVQGNFDHVNNQNVATGYERVGGRLLPVRFTVPSGASAHAAVVTGLTVYRLLRGYGDGVLIGINDTGMVAYGNVGRNDMVLPSTAAVWPVPDRPMKLPLKGLVAGVYRHFSSAISLATDTGWRGGEITAKGKDVAYLIEPRVSTKLLGITALVNLVGTSVPVGVRTEVNRGLDAVERLLKHGERNAGCKALRGMHNALNDERDYLEHLGPTLGADSLIELYDGLTDGLRDLGGELGCGTLITVKLLEPTDMQSPYAGTPLAWKTPSY